jgi:hypothetical protein
MTTFYRLRKMLVSTRKPNGRLGSHPLGIYGRCKSYFLFLLVILVFGLGHALSQSGGPPAYYGGRRDAGGTGHELDVYQLLLPYGRIASTYCPTVGLTASYIAGGGCAPNFGAIGAGTILTQGSTGIRVLRMTDSVSDPGDITGQKWTNITGNSEQYNTWSVDDNYVCLGHVSAGDLVFAFNPTTFQPVLRSIFGKQTAVLWPGQDSKHHASLFTCTFSRLTPGLFYNMTNGGVLETANAATDPNKNTPGGTPVFTVVNDFTSTVDKCFGQSAAGGRYSAPGVLFNPLWMDHPTVSDGDITVAFAASNVKNGCWDPKNGVLDWQANAAYTSSTCGAVSCGSTLPGGIAGILPMDANNPGGFVYQVSMMGTSGGTRPNWSSCQNVGCTIFDGVSGLKWVAIGQAGSWGGNPKSGTNIVHNSCGGQGYGTLYAVYHVNSGGGENAGDCDLLDTGIQHAFHNGTDLGQVTINYGNTCLFTLHSGYNTLSPNWVDFGVTVIFGTPGNIGASCNWNSGDTFWNVNTTQAYHAWSTGHATYGHSGFWGSTTNPLFANSAFVTASTKSNYVLPLQNTNPGCGVAVTCFANGNYGQFGPGEHVNWTYNSNDTQPFIFTTYNPTGGYNGFDKPFVDPQLNEVDIYQIDNSWNHPIRECQTMSSETGDFGSRYQSFNTSSDGKYVSFTSDGMNSVGDTGTGTCGPNWTPNTTYATGTNLVPLLNNQPQDISTNSCVWQNTGACTSGSSTPNWLSVTGLTTSCTATGTISDGSCTWSPARQSSCRYDVFICELE